MQLIVFTPLPPCIPFSDEQLLEFCDKSMMTDQERVRCNTFFHEMTLDRRINTLRQNENFKQ